MTHTWFRVVCSCGAKMHGDTDGPYDVLLSIFMEGHVPILEGHARGGHTVRAASANTREDAKAMPTLATLLKQARAAEAS